MGTKYFSLDLALHIFKEIESYLAEVCTRTIITGPTRRKSPRVPALDVLIIPRSREQVSFVLADLGAKEYLHLKKGTEQNIRFVHCYTGLPVVLNICKWSNWWPRLFVTTGSPQYIHRLILQAKSRGILLLPDGSRMEQYHGTPIKLFSEKAIFWALSAKYLPPEERY